MAMAKEFPGFYFDDKRHRYFPLSSKPPQNSQIQSPASDRIVDVPIRRTSLFSLDNAYHSAISYTDRDRALQYVDVPHPNPHRKIFNPPQQALLKHISLDVTFVRFNQSTSLNGNPRRYLGDDRGWLYTCSTYHEPDMQMWTPELNLHPHSQVSSINISGQKCV
ncbi:hypothetical protein D9758_002611 [Tetrapyrgos nigripes]|uniref:Uncharacterized protein n=1 Tax=Tetrapyrgos nigripes TaxID=182062 RepID=A0A8H5GQQ3_9AGAR|nr:hypothetical protein D9758_002611 [Tetrapyrgos nigripes]